MEKIKHLARFGWVSLALAWLFDFLFWDKSPGISFFIFTAACLTAGLALSALERQRPALSSLALSLPVLLFASVSFLRQEMFTVMLSTLATLCLLALLAVTLLGGRWPAYSLTDYLLAGFRLGASMLARPLDALQELRRRRAALPPERPVSRKGLPVLRGVAITLPVVAVLAGLLASADPVFNQALNHLLDFFHIENLAEYLFRGVYIVLLAYLLTGVLLHALTRSRGETLAGVEKPWLAPFLGWTETVILLGSVNLLFAAFVAIQFRYFFGGQANITVAGFTYAEYARRGFSELVAVAVISLLLTLGLSTIARRETRAQQGGFTALVGLLAGLVLVILVSAFQRLLLYEGVYGFTHLRTYTHVFIPWLGLLLAATAILVALRRPRAFGLAALITAVGFTASLSLLNVDAFVTRQNISRAAVGQELDLGYLASLTSDALPVLVEQFHNSRLPTPVRDQIGGALACRAVQDGEQLASQHWQSFNLSRSRGEALLAGMHADLLPYLVYRDEVGAWQVRAGGMDQPCWSAGALD